MCLLFKIIIFFFSFFQLLLWTCVHIPQIREQYWVSLLKSMKGISKRILLKTPFFLVETLFYRILSVKCHQSYVAIYLYLCSVTLIFCCYCLVVRILLFFLLNARTIFLYGIHIYEHMHICMYMYYKQLLSSISFFK